MLSVAGVTLVDMNSFLGLSATAWTGLYTIITFFLLVAAIFAAVYAKRQWENAREQVEETRKAQQEAHRPYIVVTVEPSLVSQVLFDLVVMNIGQRPAVDVSVNLDPPPKRAREVAGAELFKAKMLTEPIAMIAPNQKMRAFYDSNLERKDRHDLPTSHTVSLSYRDTSGHEYTEDSLLDLEAMKGTMYTEVKTVHHLAKTLEDISKILKRSSLLKLRGALEVKAVIEEREANQARVEAQNAAARSSQEALRRLLNRDAELDEREER